MDSLNENSNIELTKDISDLVLNKSSVEPENNSEKLSFDSNTVDKDSGSAVQDLHENYEQCELENNSLVNGSECSTSPVLNDGPNESNITRKNACLFQNTVKDLEADGNNHTTSESSTKKSRLSLLVDSESDEELHNGMQSSTEILSEEKMQSTQNTEDETVCKPSDKKALWDSESDEELHNDIQSGTKLLPEKKIQSAQNTENGTVYKPSNKKALWDSDSDEELHNDIQSSTELLSEKKIQSAQNTENGTVYKPSDKKALWDSDSDEELHNNIESSTEPTQNMENDTVGGSSDQTARKSSETRGFAKKSRFSLLVDSESDEEPHNDIESNTEPLSGEKNQPTQNTENETVCDPSDATDINLEKNGQITAKEVKELRKEIQSESQRMLREKNLSLPYHRPKAHSLKEFLSRRPRLALSASTNVAAPPSVAIKMSAEQLGIISKKLKEREKEVKEFYQSESESEKEDDPDYTGPNIDKDQSNKEEEIENSQNILNIGDNLDSSTLPQVVVEEKEKEENEMDTNAAKETVCAGLPNEENPHPNSDSNPDDNNKNHNNETQKACDIKNNVIKSKISLLKENLSSFVPQLSGRLEKTIDLNCTLAKPKEVVDLMERFVKHATTKKHITQPKVNMSIVTVESGGNIQKETVAMNIDSDDETDNYSEKPGAKLQRLKQELHKYMDDKKSEIWKQKMATAVPEKEESCMDDDQLDEEEELFSNDEDLTEESESETENDTGKDNFLNLEAEESLEEPIRSKDDKDSNCSESQENSRDTENENESQNSEISRSKINEKHTFSRIQQVSDDSDEEDSFFDNAVQESRDQLDSTITADEDDIPAHQPRQLQTPMRPALSQIKSISDFLTPVSFITSIQNLTSATKGNKNDSAVVAPPKTTSNPSTQEAGLDMIQRQLFSNSQQSGATESLSSLQYISDGSSDQITLREIQTENNEPPSTQDLMEICSGKFTGEECTNPTQSDCNEKNYPTSSWKSDSDHDMVITQLLDEEELENFKKKFESPVHRVTQKSLVSERQEVSGGAIIDSDSDDESQKIELKKKKNKKRIQYSDDESSEEESEQQEEIDLVDKDDLEDNLSDNSDQEENDQQKEIGSEDKNKADDLIDYDSEENDISQENYGKRPAEFFDAEAELSESEWGSEDEDEKGLDELEFELADTEDIDQKKVKEDLEKIHMRRMLDDDAREVQLLQEIYLEDGEMHGAGRQKQFKWKNIDSSDFPVNEDENDEEIYLDEEESEEQWRKKRHEREMFFKVNKEKTSDNEDDDLLSHSQLLKIGQRVLKRSSIQINSQESEKTVDISEPISKTPIISLTKRGSFLNRSDEVLQRVAEHTKVTEVTLMNTTKSSKNFLFVSTSSEVVTPLADTKKRKAAEQTPKALKKLRLNNRSAKKKLPAEKSKDNI